MRLEIFKSWCAQQGIQSILDVRVRNGNERYTILARDIDESESKTDILSVPLDACLTAVSSEELADRLAFEKSQESSHWSPHLDVLPTIQDLEDLPRFWKPEKWEKVVDGGFLLLEHEKILKRQENLDPWALACVDSRANFLPDYSYSITPFLDMINHNATVGTRMRIDPETGVATLSVDTDSLMQEQGSWMQSFLQGGGPSSEVKISYGKLTNLETLSSYGFVEEDNVFNREQIEVRMMRQPPLTVEVEADGGIETTAIRMLRSYLVNREEMELLAVKDELGVLSPFVSERNEMEVYALLGGFLEEACLEARVGAKEADGLISVYLRERSKTLQRAMEQISSRYPGLLG